MKKLYVCDFDGTLYNKYNERQFKSALEYIEKLKEKGNEFIVATGRPLHLLEPFFPDFNNMYFISCDGALFSKGFNIIKSFPISKEKVKEKLSGYVGNFIAYGQCITYINCKEKAFAHKLSEFYRHHITRIDCVCEIKEDIYKISLNPDSSACDFLSKCWSSYGITEYVDNSVTKGECLKFAMDHLGFKKENTIVMGDGENDISMMQYASESYAMISASPKVKAEANKTVNNVLDILRGEI